MLAATLAVVGTPTTEASAAPGDELLYQFQGQIYRTTEAGGGEISLTPGRSHLGLAEPSPDGTQIAYQVGPGGPYRIEIMDIDGTNVRSITTGNRPVWSPDGSHLYFREFSGSWRNYQINIATGTRTEIARQVVRWNHDGTAYLFTHGGNLYSSTASVSTDPTLDRTLIATGADEGWWHPDNDLILYRTSSALHTVNPNGSGQTLLVDVSGGSHTPFADWSPDGSKVAYVTSDLDGIYTINADGTGSQQIRTEFGYNVPRFAGPARPSTDPCIGGNPAPSCEQPPLDILVVGDSIAWGQGLRFDQKYSSIVARHLETTTGRELTIHTYAHSGAEMQGDCLPEAPGEVTHATPSTKCQIQTASAVADVDYDLVLLSGCINDVSVEYIFTPGASEALNRRQSVVNLRSQVIEACEAALTEMVVHAKNLPGRPKVVVTGYYPMVSRLSDADELATALAAGLGLDTIFLPQFWRGDLRDWAAHRSHTFDIAVAQLGQRIARRAGPDVVFVSPRFNRRTAVFTPNSYLWGGTDDPLFNLRSSQCEEHAPDPLPATGFKCSLASLGHPNEAGAARYAQQIIRALRVWSFDGA